MWLVGLWVVAIAIVVGRISYLKLKHERDVSSGKIVLVDHMEEMEEIEKCTKAE